MSFDVLGDLRPDEMRLQAYRRIVKRVRNTVDAALPTTAALVSIHPRTPSRRQLGASWRRNVTPLLDQIDPIFAALALQLQTVTLEQTRPADDRQSAQRNAVTGATSKVTALGEQIETACAALIAQAQRIAVPARPQPQDALQEAHLASLKSDLGLITARIDVSADIRGSTFIDRLIPRLSAAVADGDKLAEWLLTTSDWPLQILAPSLGYTDVTLETIATTWPHALADVLASGSPDMATAISIYQTLADPSEGLNALVVATGAFLGQVVGDINDYVMRTQPWAA